MIVLQNAIREKSLHNHSNSLTVGREFKNLFFAKLSKNLSTSFCVCLVL